MKWMDQFFQKYKLPQLIQYGIDHSDSDVRDHSVWFLETVAPWKQALEGASKAPWKGLVRLPGKPGNAGGRHDLTLTPRVPMEIRPEMTFCPLKPALPRDKPCRYKPDV